MIKPKKPKPDQPFRARERRPHETGGPHDYRGNPDLVDEANEPGDRVQGSDGMPVSGKP